MALSDLTDRDAVIQAIREFDEIGRDNFLEKYGFRFARRYFLLLRGGRYDSKAIAGAAHGFQHPNLGPLKSGDLSAGESTVAKRLRTLGFEITTTGYNARPPKYWALCANPRRYRVQDAVRHLDLDYWAIRRSDLRAGDRAVIWQTLDQHGQRGVIAFGEIVGNAEVRADADNPYWVEPSDGETIQARVLVRYSDAPGLPLWIDESEDGTFLRSLSVAKSQGGTCFHIGQEQWRHLLELAGGWSAPTESEISSSEQIRYRSSRSSGQGFGLTSAERQAVERHAMVRAEQYLEQHWDEVRDVSATASFDFLCRIAGLELRVEVKGTTGTGSKVILTKNEVRESEEPGYAMFLVTQIQLDRSDPNTPVASGGTCIYFPRWDKNAHILEPHSYTCDLNLDLGIEVIDE